MSPRSEVLKALKKRYSIRRRAAIYVTRDLGSVARVRTTLLVLYGGNIQGVDDAVIIEHHHDPHPALDGCCAASARRRPRRQHARR